MEEDRQLTIEHETLTPQGVYPILRVLDGNVRELKEETYANQRDVNARLNRLEEEVSEMKRAITDVKISVGVTEHILTEVKADVKAIQQDMNEIRGDMKAISSQVNTLQSKLGLYISLLGIGISVMLVIFQMLMK